MLDKLRDRAAQILAETTLCTLATTGPAGLQASMVQCAERETALYVLVPDTSDHLFNLESTPEVAVTTETWQMHGIADFVADPVVFSVEQCQWHTVVRITPVRLHILPTHSGPATHAETIDFDG